MSLASVDLDNLLFASGYRLVEDAWATDGRRTYRHDDDANRAYITGLGIVLKASGWKMDQQRLRSFVRSESSEVIEIEPGGADTSGHFLHHMKAQR